jgi:hypothetical protein
MTSGAGTQFVTGNEWNNKDSFSFFFFILLLFPSTQIYITQGCSLYSFKSSKGVNVAIIERDNIL